MDIMAPFTAWTATCCNILQQCAQADGDFVLSYLVQFTSYTNVAKDIIYGSSMISEQQSKLVMFGLEAQGQELRQRMLPYIACSGKNPQIALSELKLRV